MAVPGVLVGRLVPVVLDQLQLLHVPDPHSAQGQGIDPLRSAWGRGHERTNIGESITSDGDAVSARPAVKFDPMKSQCLNIRMLQKYFVSKPAGYDDRRSPC